MAGLNKKNHAKIIVPYCRWYQKVSLVFSLQDGAVRISWLDFRFRGLLKIRARGARRAARCLNNDAGLSLLPKCGAACIHCIAARCLNNDTQGYHCFLNVVLDAYIA